MFVLALHTLYGWPCGEVFKLAKQAGFDAIEIDINRDPDTFNAEALNLLQSQYNLPIYSVHSPFCAYVPGWKNEPVERVLRAASLAESLKAKVVVAHPPLRFMRPTAADFVTDLLLSWPPGSQKKFKRWLENELKAFQEKAQVVIAVENMPPVRIGPFNAQPYEYSGPDDMAMSENIALDVTHLGAGGFDILRVYDKLKSRVSHIHLSNYNGREHRLLNDGTLPLKEFLFQLKLDGFNKGIVLEFMPKAAGADNRDTAYRNLSDSMVFCRKIFG